MIAPAPPPALSGLAPHALRAGFARLAGRLPPSTEPDLWSTLDPGLRRALGTAAEAPSGDHILPSHLERVDPTWLLVDAWGQPLSPRSLAVLLLAPSQRRAVCRALGTRAPDPSLPAPPLAMWAARHAWGHLVSMPPEGLPGSLLAGSEGSEPASPHAPDPRDLSRAIPRLGAPELHDLIVRLGAPRLGTLLARVPRRAAAALAGRLPRPLREATWQARAATGEHTAPLDRDALQRLRDEVGDADPATLLFSLGARLLAAFLRESCPSARAQCAQLLPKPAGRLLLGDADPVPPGAEQILTFLRNPAQPVL